MVHVALAAIGLAAEVKGQGIPVIQRDGLAEVGYRRVELAGVEV